MLLNKEKEDIVEKTPQTPPRAMDLMCKHIYFSGYASRVFVYDENDPTATKLYALFAGKNYEEHNLGGINGYALRGRRLDTATDGSQVARVPVLQHSMTLIEANGTRVLSRGTPIHRYYNIDGSLTLLVKKDL